MRPLAMGTALVDGHLLVLHHDALGALRLQVLQDQTSVLVDVDQRHSARAGIGLVDRSCRSASTGSDIIARHVQRSAPALVPAHHRLPDARNKTLRPFRVPAYSLPNCWVIILSSAPIRSARRTANATKFDRPATQFGITSAWPTE